MSDYYNVSKVRELGEKVSEIPFTKPHGKRVVAIGDRLTRENAFDISEELANHKDLSSAMYSWFEYYTIPDEIADSIRG